MTQSQYFQMYLMVEQCRLLIWFIQVDSKNCSKHLQVTDESQAQNAAFSATHIS